jgi:hypothetical protein
MTMAMDRREFLGKSALALGAAFSLTSLGLGAEEAQAAPLPACPEVSGLEKWLLQTGQSHMDNDVYAVACQAVR